MVDTLNIRTSALHDTALSIDTWLEAVRGCDLATVRKMLAGGMDPDGADAHGHTALHIPIGCTATQAGVHAKIDVLAALHGAGARLDIQARDGNTPLHCLAGADDLLAARWVLARATHEVLLARNHTGDTPLAVAVKNPAGEAMACAIVLALQDRRISPEAAMGWPAEGWQMVERASQRGWARLAGWMTLALRHAAPNPGVRRPRP